MRVRSGRGRPVERVSRAHWKGAGALRPGPAALGRVSAGASAAAGRRTGTCWAPRAAAPRPIHGRAEEKRPPSPAKEFCSLMGFRLEPGSSSLAAAGLPRRAQMDSEAARRHTPHATRPRADSSQRHLLTEGYTVRNRHTSTRTLLLLAGETEHRPQEARAACSITDSTRIFKRGDTKATRNRRRSGPWASVVTGAPAVSQAHLLHLRDPASLPETGNP